MKYHQQKIGDFEIPRLPRIPRHKDVPTDPYKMDLPKGCAEIADYTRTEALNFIRNDPSITAFGLGLKEKNGMETSEFALQFFVKKKLSEDKVPKGCLLPKEIKWQERKFPVDVVEFPIQLQGMAATTKVRQTGAFAGSSISNHIDVLADGLGGGTLGGTFTSLRGNRQRGITACHVALGLQFSDFFERLKNPITFLGAIMELFRSPRGRKIYYADPRQVGQQINQLMKIDTPWPMLVPVPFTVMAGFLLLIYVDAAAGRVNPVALPNPPNFYPPVPPAPVPKKMTVAGTKIKSARYPTPGTKAYLIGQTSGISWGKVKNSFLGIVLTLPQLIAGLPVVILFDQILTDITIRVGDSGSSLLTQDGNRYLGSCWLSASRPSAVSSGVGHQALATPWWWLSLLMNIKFH